MSQARLFVFPILALAVLGCASANRLSKRSEKDLAAGDLGGAYEHARRAVAKEPGNPRARAAFEAAAATLVHDREARILSIAEADTLAAAERVLELADLRGQIGRHGYVLPADTAFTRHETAIRLGAAAFRYSAAEHALARRAPKVAWAEFREAQRFVPGYRDVTRRIGEAHAQGLARVAIIPFADQVGVTGISRALTDRVYAEVGRHVRPGEFEFTKLIDPGQVYARITVAELDDLSREDAIRVGRRLGADQVVTGRIYGLRTSTNTVAVRQPIFRKVVERDTSGRKIERYVEFEFHAIERERTVTVHYDLDVVDTEDETSLARFTDAVEGYARVVFSDFQPTGDCREYCLVPPELRRSDPSRASRIEAEWKSHFGNWTLPALLEKSRSDPRRLRYSASDRQAFYADCRERPVWLGDLPDENDMAAIALDVVWQPVLGMLKELDAK